MKDYCNKCGACCKAITIPLSAEKIQDRINEGETGKDFQFANKQWVQRNFYWMYVHNKFYWASHFNMMFKQMREEKISFPNSLSYKTIHEKMDWFYNVRRSFFNKEVFVFSCNKHNAETGECMAYEERPQVCSGYPLYKNTFLEEEHLFYDDKCGYKELLVDQKEAKELVDTKLSQLIKENEEE